MSKKSITHILLVEDEAADAVFIKTLLQGATLERFEVALVGRITAAIDYVTSHKVDAVLLDLSLPDSFGMETINIFRNAIPNMPVVVLTGLDGRQMGIQSIAAGCQDYLIKGENDGNTIARSILHAIERKRLELELLYIKEQHRQAEERYRLLVDALPDAILVCSAEEVLFLNNAAKQLCYGPIASEAQAYRLIDLVTPQHALQVSNLIECVINGTQAIGRLELQLRAYDGRLVNAEVIVLPFNHGGIPSAEFVIHDLTVRREADHYRALAATVFEGSAEAMLLTDVNMRILMVNAAFTKITQYSKDEVIGKNPSILASGRNSPEFYQAMWHKILSAGHWSGDIWNRRKNGELYVQYLTISAIHDRNGVIENFVGVFGDVTAQRQQEDQVRHMALHDALTGLPNRVLLEDRTEQAITQAHRRDTSLAVLFLDLDGFKPINDVYGHQVGDEVLRQVAQRLQECVREVDTVARVGGDEFVVVLADITTDISTVRVAEAILATIQQPIITAQAKVSVGSSVGIAIFPQDGSNYATLLGNADAAMYAAKKSGKGKFCFFSVCSKTL